MSTPFAEDLEEIIYLSTSQGSGEDMFRIDVRRLLVGMFVAQIDRPWADTPLPQNGLLIASDDDLAAVRSHCRHVMVDPDRSADGMRDAIKAASVLSCDQTFTLADGDFADPARAPAAWAAASDSAPSVAGERTPARRRAALEATPRDDVVAAPAFAPRRNDVHPTSEARSRVRKLLLGRDGCAGQPHRSGSDGPVSRLRSWFRRDPHDAGTTNRRSLEALRELYGPCIGAAEPDPDNLSIRDSLPVARPAHARLVAAADAVVVQVRQGGVPAIAPIVEAADSFVDAAVRAPDAMRWAGAIYRQTTPLPNPAAAVALRLVEFGRALGMPAQSLRDLALVGVLCDIGKALLPRELLEQPGVLAAHDYALVQQHVTIGLDLLSRSATLPEAVLRGIAEHHERLDGSGYPGKRTGEAIGLHGRMAGIVDTYCGLTAMRAYAHPLSVEDALSALHGWAGAMFCRDLVEYFIRAVGVFPIGTMVELRSGEVAAVVDRQPGQQFSPRLVVLTGADKGPLRVARDRAGPQEPDQVYSGAPVRIARGLPAGAYGLRLMDFYARPPSR